MKQTRLHVGDTFGYWTVIDDNAISVHNNSGLKRKYLCRCKCGTERYITTSDLKSGHSKSCGCLQKTANGEHNTRLYRIWNKMKDRCYNKNHVHYYDYGGRGIKVCDEWRNNFLNFREWALLHGYNENLTIDRIDNDKGYSPDNCHWVDRIAQQNNLRWNRKMTLNGKTQNLSQWSRELNIPVTTIYSRISAGWTDEKALSYPIDKSKSTKRRKTA